MNIFEETQDTFAKLIIFAVGLILPSAIVIYSVLGSASLKEGGYETTSKVVSTTGNVYGEATTTFGTAIFNFVMTNLLLAWLLCFCYVIAKKYH